MAYRRRRGRRGGRGGMIVTSFVKKGHDSRHPGFAGKAMAVPSAGKRGYTKSGGYRRKGY